MVDIRDYLRDGVSTAEAFHRACAALGEGDTLCLEARTYDFYAADAFRAFYAIANNDAGEKPVAFPLIGKKNITIDGGGARLLFHDGMIPFVVDDSVGVTIRHLTVDYTRLLFTQAEIVQADEQRVVLRFDGNEFFCRVQDGLLCFSGVEPHSDYAARVGLCLEFEPDKKAPSDHLPNYFFHIGENKNTGFLKSMYRDVAVQQLGENLIELRGDFGFRHTVGNRWVCTYGGREHPGVFIQQSRDVLVADVTFHYAASMGVIAQTSEDITLRRVVAAVADDSDRMLSVKADATHFVNCRGKLVLDGCRFVSMMDDACNIHGIYLKAPVRVDAYTFEAGYGHSRQRGVNIFRPGDTARLLCADTLGVLGDWTVTAAVLTAEDRLRVTVSEPLCDIPAGYIVENLSTAPAVHIVDSECGNNRPRGVLLASAGKTVVERCKFYTMFAAVHIGSELLDWYESGPTTDVVIRDNDFCNSAYAGGTAIVIAPRIRNKETVGCFHDRIVIENNRFTMCHKRFLAATNVRQLRFVGNTFVPDATLPAHEPYGADGFYVQYCDNPCLEPVKE